jgi:hypothetical protein
LRKGSQREAALNREKRGRREKALSKLLLHNQEQITLVPVPHLYKLAMPSSLPLPSDTRTFLAFLSSIAMKHVFASGNHDVWETK